MKYKRFNVTRAATIIVDTTVEITWTSNNKKRYVDLGYEYTKQFDKFICRVEDVSPGSGVPVKIECPVCGEHRTVEYKHMKRFGHTLCNGCSHIVDLTGEIFERWTIIEFYKTINGAAYWLCQCECGEKKAVQYSGLISGTSRSCGCLNVDLTRERSGEKSPTWKGGEVELVCEQCGGKYSAKRCHVKKSRFCSRSCQGAWVSENMSGKNSPHWNFDLTQEERIINRNYPEYRQWSKAVLSRDRYVCQCCGERGDEVEAHHLYSYRHYPEYALDINYGITLMKDHHREFHKWMGGNGVECTPADFDRWMYETM